MKLEDGGADLGDDAVKGVHVSRDSGTHRGVGDVTGQSLQSESDREDLLNDVVMQVAGDTVMILELRQLQLVRSSRHQLEGNGGTGSATAWVRVTSETGSQVVLKDVQMKSETTTKAGENYA